MCKKVWKPLRFLEKKVYEVEKGSALESERPLRASEPAKEVFSMAPRKQPWTVRHEMAVQMLANGQPIGDLYQACFGTDLSDKLSVRNAQKALRKLQAHPEWNEHYRDYISKRLAGLFGKAINVIGEQLDDSNGWLRNKAANDVSALAKNAVLGTDDHTVTVKVEGMPDIGSPDAEDDA